MATRKGLEPSTSSVTGWHSNQLNYRTGYGGNNRARTCDPLLVRQVLSQLSYAPLTASSRFRISCVPHLSATWTIIRKQVVFVNSFFAFLP